MPLIIDTYNVLHVVGVLPPDLAGIDTEGLIRLLEASRYRSDPVLLACDGRPGPGAPTGKHGHVTIRYSGPGVTADELIGKLIQASSVPRRLTVVSSDRAIVREARRRRCRTLSSKAFLRELATDCRHLGGSRSRPPGGSTGPRPEGSTPLSEGQVEEWLGTFELGEGSAPIEPLPEPEGAPSPEPPPLVIPPTPAPTIMPGDLLAEAEDLVAEAKQAEQAEAERMAEARAEAERPAATPAMKKDEPPGPPATPALLPREILDQAERLAADPQAAGDAEPPPGVAGSGGPASPPDDRDGPRRRGLDLLPDDILAEAESLLRDAAGEDKPDAADEDD